MVAAPVISRGFPPSPSMFRLAVCGIFDVVRNLAHLVAACGQFFMAANNQRGDCESVPAPRQTGVDRSPAGAVVVP